MQKIMEIIRAAMASFRMVLKPIMIAGKWTTTLVQEAYKELAPPIRWAADKVINAAEYAVEGALSLPLAVLAGLTQGRGGRANQQTENAGVQTDAQIKAAARQQEAALTATQTARILQRACKWRSGGRDAADLVDALPQALRAYAQKLTVAECVRMAEFDPKTIIAWVAGERESLPGIRTTEEVALEGSERVKTPLSGAAKTPAEQQVMDILADRLHARTQHQDDNEEENVVPPYRAL